MIKDIKITDHAALRVIYHNLASYQLTSMMSLSSTRLVSDIAVFVLKRDVKLQLTLVPDLKSYNLTCSKQSTCPKIYKRGGYGPLDIIKTWYCRTCVSSH